MAVAITAFKDNKIDKNMQDLFQDLIAHSYLSPESKTLCVDTPTGSDVSTLRKIGVPDAVEISKKASKPLVIFSDSRWILFVNDSFDFVFSGDGALEKSLNPSEFAAEIAWTLKPEGFAAFHVKAKHTYSSNPCKGNASGSSKEDHPAPPAAPNILMTSRDHDSPFNSGGISFLSGSRNGRSSYGYSSFKGKGLQWRISLRPKYQRLMVRWLPFSAFLMDMETLRASTMGAGEATEPLKQGCLMGFNHCKQLKKITPGYSYFRSNNQMG
ncbi:hypothetical protein SESBI_12502 [Sesbania bispinosa]|nr:hypothetical protein SESBI_12502 [Sesbania bispinosa]